MEEYQFILHAGLFVALLSVMLWGARQGMRL